MSRKVLLISVIMTLLLFVGCSSEPSDTSTLSSDEVSTMLNDADSFKGRTVEGLGLEVFQIINEEEGNYQFQAWADADGNNSVIVVCDKNYGLKEGDYILLTGSVNRMEEFENAFGATLQAPVLYGTDIIIADATVFNPAEKTVQVNQEQTQYGIKVIVEKVEFAPNSTRVYIKVVNNSNDKIDLYEFDSYIKYGSKQYADSEISYEENTLDISSLVPGTEDGGLLSFEPITLSGGSMVISLSVSSDDWDIDLSPFDFAIEIQ